ncbi:MULTISPECIES: hypothetical protein [Amycolatopsis]|uniref:MinD-like ATPase involved in chromosome partitioning or flagellar assembly n=1 Tax=Amycolatopsis bullii TaxID=941987 RepID=A0ABQ3K9A5_9PSEU|nr:hypothetical protein [Amycolatopsis bullii]GHG09001.1 hypothetical protein GCM10017567_27380 [Amycolatopsis bullii]
MTTSDNFPGDVDSRVDSTDTEGQPATSAEQAVELVDWSPFGRVLPVLAGSPGAGATSTAVAIADALQLAGRSVLLVDAGDPVRSGLGRAARADGPRRDGPGPAAGIRFSRRARAILARLDVPETGVEPVLFPPPPYWHPGGLGVDVTVVDIGHDPWRLATDPALGPGQWLRVGSPSPIPALVVRPTVPGLAHAEQVLARLEPWVRAAAVTPPTQLLVVGTRSWPKGVAGTAGRRTSILLPDTVFFPRERHLAEHGVTADVTPSSLRAPAEQLLRSWHVLPQQTRRLRLPLPRRAHVRDGRAADQDTG